MGWVPLVLFATTNCVYHRPKPASVTNNFQKRIWTVKYPLKKNVFLSKISWDHCSPPLSNPLGKPHIPIGSRLKQSPHCQKVNRTKEREFLSSKSLPFQEFYLPQDGEFRAALQVSYHLGTKDAARGPRANLWHRKGKKDPHNSSGLSGSCKMLLQNRHRSLPNQDLEFHTKLNLNPPEQNPTALFQRAKAHQDDIFLLWILVWPLCGRWELI